MSKDLQYSLFSEEIIPEEIKTTKILNPKNQPMGEIKEKEIDISDIFSGIRKFFSNIFYQIGLGFLYTVYFIKRYGKIIGLVAVLGAVAGLVYSLAGKPFFTATMVVKSNDNYLEKNIFTKILDELNTMCDEGDFEELSSVLNITLEQAKSLRWFELEEEKEIANLGSYYNKYFKLLSTISDEEKREQMLDLFIKSETDNIYYISASVYDASVLPLLNEPLAKLMNSNPYFVKQRGINDVAFRASEQKIYDELTKLDSLKRTLTNAIESNEKNLKSGSNNIIFGENQLYNPLPVYEKYLSLYNDAITIKKQIFLNENTVEVLSGFVKLKKNERLNPLLGGFSGMGFGLLAGILFVLFLLSIEKFRKLEIPSKVNQVPAENK